MERAGKRVLRETIECFGALLSLAITITQLKGGGFGTLTLLTAAILFLRLGHCEGNGVRGPFPQSDFRPRYIDIL